MIEQIISEKIRQHFPVQHLELINESGMHAGPATESHFKLILASEDFSGMSRVKRHQAVYRLLSEEMAGPVHALALHLYSPEEWQSQSDTVPGSPQCSNK